MREYLQGLLDGSGILYRHEDGRFYKPIDVLDGIANAWHSLHPSVKRWIANELLKDCDD